MKDTVAVKRNSIGINRLLKVYNSSRDHDDGCVDDDERGRKKRAKATMKQNTKDIEEETREGRIEGKGSHNESLLLFKDASLLLKYVLL